MKLVIVRGIPGSGKTFTAKQIAGTEGLIFSTDNFFIKDGKYEFKPNLIGKAHEWNYDCAEQAMKEKRPLVIIDNTNTTAWEMKKYVLAGRKYGYEVTIQEPTSSWWQEFQESRKDPKWADFFAKKNTHGVPKDTIVKMINRWEDVKLENIK